MNRFLIKRYAVVNNDGYVGDVLFMYHNSRHWTYLVALDDGYDGKLHFHGDNPFGTWRSAYSLSSWALADPRGSVSFRQFSSHVTTLINFDRERFPTIFLDGNYNLIYKQAREVWYSDEHDYESSCFVSDIRRYLENAENGFEHCIEMFNDSTAPVSEDEPQEFISELYESRIVYAGGRQGYHAHHGEYLNKPVKPYAGYRFGIELEVECKDESSFDTLTHTNSNWFYHERDGSLGEYGDEIVTVPLRPSDAKNREFWEPFLSYARKYAESACHKSTGLHVHISRSILGTTAEHRSETLGKLLFFYHHMLLQDPRGNALNEKIYGRAHTYHEMEGTTEVGDAAKLLGKDCFQVDSVCNQVENSMIDKAREGRYCDINIMPRDTIEFRKGKGAISADRIVSICAWSELMVLYCRMTKWDDLSVDGFLCEAESNEILRTYF